MANACVKRVMIDTGSSADILYFDAFQKLGLTDKDLVTLTSILTGFTGDIVSPMGAATIAVTFGGESRSKTLMVSFMVVKLPSAYHAIIGCPTLNRLKAVVSTYHRLLKFPIQAWVDEIRSDPRESRQCYLTTKTLSKRPKVQLDTVDPRSPEDSARYPHPAEQVLEVPLRCGRPDMSEPAWHKHGRARRHTADLTRIRWARPTSPNCRKDGARLAARTTDGVVRCDSMVSNKEDKSLRYGYPVTVTIKTPTPLRRKGITNSITKLT
ncbi:hypothetical protein BHM03_00018269 [Ensete ventricosum]|nr:hypothetical protein BHM03_00018269 [Ensete ventricosum]